MALTTSVLIPSYRRPAELARCLAGLDRQSMPPDEILVVWQGDDTVTRETAEEFARTAAAPVRVLHNLNVGIVPAENLALRHMTGDIALLVDDDAEPHPHWVEWHQRHYSDPLVGAVGGSMDNYRPDGTPFPRRAAMPVGKLTWFGRLIGNLHDQAEPWRRLPPLEIDHVVGCNASFRRCALDRFEEALLPYWQMFEAEACLMVKSRGYRILFDFENAIAHHPLNRVFEGGRHGDLHLKVFHSCYNQAFLLSKHTKGMLRACRLAYLLGAGSVNGPGLLAFVHAIRIYGDPRREWRILQTSWRYHLSGWRAGAAARKVRAAEISRTGEVSAAGI
jgi:glycosyltransferase involved in cell wall biosynthesis